MTVIPQSSQNILDRIKPIKPSNLGSLKFSVYGTPKTGKTRFACTFPKPLLLIGAEDGTASVSGVQGVDFLHLEHTEELYQCVDLLKTGKYKTVVLDTATKLRDMRLCELTGNSRVVVQKKWGDVTREQYMQCAENLKRMLSLLLDVPRDTLVNVVIIAQEANLTHDDSKTGSDILRPVIASALGKSCSEFLNAECDYVAQMFIRLKIKDKIEQLGNIEHTTQVTVGSEYVMRVGPDPVYKTGFRRSLNITTPLPDFIVDPDYDKIVKIIKGEIV